MIAMAGLIVFRWVGGVWGIVEEVSVLMLL